MDRIRKVTKSAGEAETAQAREAAWRARVCRCDSKTTVATDSGAKSYSGKK
ncbi:unnamed protein product [Kuraishia capsulata CBS 1993]|uniref:Uncharacterized protein n=1 Tax=Kuraishia capsulata CBS 1993 TaxID=1382522 RepID=W6MNL2_9ASCO|nr:uncharacterized protein KUCA_T00002610001 [Kuraishia capsulata CBS 1993]CDK26637.1 unnamed protein product [Kuraishia capsulata CBS 1993]